MPAYSAVLSLYGDKMKKFITCLGAMAIVLAFSPVNPVLAAPGKSVKKSLVGKSSLRKGKKRYRSSKKRRRKAVFTCDMYSRRTLKRKSKRFQRTINHASRKYGVDKNLITAVIAVESCFNPRARGGLGEKGLMQLMPATARELGVKNGYSPWQNIHGGTKYLSYLLKRFNGNKGYAAAAYNGGPGAVSRTRGPKFKQVRRYSRHVMRAYSTMTRGKGKVTAKSSRRALKKARFSSSKKRLSKRSSKRLKKRLVRSSKRYNKTSKRASYRNKKRNSRSSGRGVRTHYVKSGQTLYSISRKHRVSVRKLKRLNRLRSNLIRTGTRLRLR